MAGINVEDTGDDGDTPLMQAARYGNARAVEYLLEHGADIERCDRFKRTALIAAARALPPDGRRVIELLIDGGANIQARDDRGRTAEQRAMKTIESWKARFKDDDSLAQESSCDDWPREEEEMQSCVEVLRNARLRAEKQRTELTTLAIDACPDVTVDKEDTSRISSEA